MTRTVLFHGGCVSEAAKQATSKVIYSRHLLQDRVETSPEQMARCTAHAERLTRETGVRVRVVGWYHSHPHITVLPSAVDVRTQALYQMLDPGFVGLIFSVFNTDTGTKAGQVQVSINIGI